MEWYYTRRLRVGGKKDARPFDYDFDTVLAVAFIHDVM